MDHNNHQENINAAVEHNSPPGASVLKSWVDIRAEDETMSVSSDDKEQLTPPVSITTTTTTTTTTVTATSASSAPQASEEDNKETNYEEGEMNSSSSSKMSSPEIVSSSLSPLIVERHVNNNNKNEDVDMSSMLSASPLSTNDRHDSSSGESFDVSDTFDTLSTVRRGSVDQGGLQKVLQLSEDEEVVEVTRRGRSVSNSSRKRRGPQIGSGSYSVPATITGSGVNTATPNNNALPTPASTASLLPFQSNLSQSASFSNSHPGSFSSSSSSSSSSLSSSYSTPSLNRISPPSISAFSPPSTASSLSPSSTPSPKEEFPSNVLPTQFVCLLQAINVRTMSISLLSFLAGALTAYWWLKRQASLKKNDRLQTEASLRQMLALKEAEVNRLSNLFEKYLSRPLLVRYLPNRF